MPHDVPLPGYTVRRPLAGRELLPAVGAGIVLGLAGFYLARLFLERTPMLSAADRARRTRVLTGVDDVPDLYDDELEEIALTRPSDMDEDGEDEYLSRLEQAERTLDVDELHDEDDLVDDDDYEDVGLAERIRDVQARDQREARERADREREARRRR